MFKYNRISKNEKSCDILKNDSVIFKTKIRTDTIGLSFYCNDKYFLTYSFIVQNKLDGFCKQVYPFFNTETQMVNSKYYEIDDHQYKLKCYSEMSNSVDGNIIYYVDGLGFICYYEVFSGSMYLCEDAKNAQLESRIVKELVNKLIVDTTFFVTYWKQKVLPTNHRFVPPDSTYENKELYFFQPETLQNK